MYNKLGNYAYRRAHCLIQESLLAEISKFSEAKVRLFTLDFL